VKLVLSWFRVQESKRLLMLPFLWLFGEVGVEGEIESWKVRKEKQQRLNDGHLAWRYGEPARLSNIECELKSPSLPQAK